MGEAAGFKREVAGASQERTAHGFSAERAEILLPHQIAG
jgi:hypothetical protein